MLCRLVRVPARLVNKATLKVQFSNLPQVIKEAKFEISEVSSINREASLSTLQEYSINFQKEMNGKTIILQAEPEIRSRFSLHDISTAIFSLGAAYGLVTNFNYALTLAFGVGAIATVFSSGRLAFGRGQNIITSIHIDTDKRLHLTYVGPEGFDVLIVDRKDFTYNIINDKTAGSDAIWCRANNTDFLISKNNLEINNHQVHNLF